MPADATYKMLRRAVEILAAGEGTIHQRLAAAYGSGLVQGLPDEELPPKLRTELVEIGFILDNAVPADGEAEPSQHTITDVEAADLARRLVDLLLDLDRCREQERP